MGTNQELNYHLYVQRSTGFTRTPFRSEFAKYMMIQSGDVEAIKRNFSGLRGSFLEGKGKLSDDPVRNIMYHFVTSVALTCRICVEGGMLHDTAYTLSDIYIQRADKCRTCEALLEIFLEMQVDFATRMRDLKKDHITSLHIRKCIDYIYDHLHESLTVMNIADLLKLNPSYLSKLFRKETGMALSDFITDARITTAENMLRYSDFTYLEISLALGFSSQSAFISTFKKRRGMTPKVYRDTYYQNNDILVNKVGSYDVSL